MASQPAQTTALTPSSAPGADSLAAPPEQGLVVSEELAEGTVPSDPSTANPVADIWTKAPKKVHSERRALPRRDGNCRVAVCRLERGEGPLTPQQMEWRLHATPLKGTVCDLSLQGAAVVLPQPIPEGEALVLRLFCPRRDHHLDQHATVLGLVPEGEGEGEWKLMCQFREKLSLEQISVFSRFLSDTDWV